MGLFNHLFGNKKNVVKELMTKDAQRVELWHEHLKNYELRESLSKQFNYGNVDKAIKDFGTTLQLLRQIESLISPELVTVNDEIKTDQIILEDLKKLKGNREYEILSANILYATRKHQELIKLFQEIYDVLRLELHLIRLIKTHPNNLRSLLLSLFEIIFHREARLYKIFIEQMYFEEDKNLHAEIVRITRAILLEEEVKEEMEKDEEKFAREILKQMIPTESKHRYRKLGEDIYLKLAEMAGAPMPRGEDLTKGIELMQKFMREDDTMKMVVKRLRPKYDDVKIRGVIIAFRNAYNLGHFEELESAFAT